MSAHLALTSDDLSHMLELVHEDLICCRRILKEYPEHPDAVRSLKLSRDVMLRLSAAVISAQYEHPDPDTVEDRIHLN